MQPETRFFKKIDPELKKIPKSFWTNIQQASIRGTLDRYGCINGHFVALEGKRDEKARRSSLQVFNVSKIKWAGGFADFIYPQNFDKVYDKLLMLSLHDSKELLIDKLEKENEKLKQKIKELSGEE